MPYKDLEKRKESARKRTRTYREKHPERTGSRHIKFGVWRRQARLKADFGISLEQYNALLVSQNYGCAICKRPRGKRRLHVDHDRDGNIRGLLCAICNPGLGFFRHKPARLRVAASCLEQHFLFPHIGRFKHNPNLLRRAAEYLERRL